MQKYPTTGGIRCAICMRTVSASFVAEDYGSLYYLKTSVTALQDRLRDTKDVIEGKRLNMKIIFSRKGFDSALGRVPSPILPDGKMCLLPIPMSGDGCIPYQSISIGQTNLGRLVFDLTKGKISPTDTAHLDPDVYHENLQRHPRWRPLFGQTGAAQGHLSNQGIKEGDIFLFFGWLNFVEVMNGKFCYISKTEGFHAVFAWIQISESILVSNKSLAPDWAQYHPHFCGTPTHSNDTVYFSRDDLKLPNKSTALPGGGAFSKFSERLRLSKKGENRSVWQLPKWFSPSGRPSTLTYHKKPSRWTTNASSVVLKTVGRGQEFILDCDHYPESIDWIYNLIFDSVHHVT